MRAIGVFEVQDIPGPSWRKSSRSAHNGNCVEVTPFPGGRVAVRDSKNRSGAPVIVGARDWTALLDSIKNATAGN